MRGRGQGKRHAVGPPPIAPPLTRVSLPSGCLFGWSAGAAGLRVHTITHISAGLWFDSVTRGGVKLPIASRLAWLRARGPTHLIWLRWALPGRAAAASASCRRVR